MPDQPAAAAATTTAGGDGLSKTLVGRAAYFSIYASDASGARATRGGEAFVVAIRGPSPATRSIRDNGDGTYTVTYCVACSGAYTVAVTLHDTATYLRPGHRLRLHVCCAAHPRIGVK